MAEPRSLLIPSYPWNRWIGWGTAAVVVLVILSVGIPAVLQLREAARRTQSRNNLRFLGLALHNYQDTFICLPPGGVFDAEGQGYHEWTTSIAPYQDASPWYFSINFNIPWDDPRQVDMFRDMHKQQSHFYSNPSLSDVYRPDGLVNNHYAGNQSLFYRNSSVSIRDPEISQQQLMVADALSEFIPVGALYGWRDVARGFLVDPAGFGCKPRGLTQCLLVDGTVRDISGTLDEPQLAALRGAADLVPPAVRTARLQQIPLIDVSKIWRVEWDSTRGESRSPYVFRPPAE